MRLRTRPGRPVLRVSHRLDRPVIPASQEVWRHAYREAYAAHRRRIAYGDVIRELIRDGKLGPEWAKFLPEAPESQP